MKKYLLAIVILLSLVLSGFSQADVCGTKEREKSNNKNIEDNKSVPDDGRRFIIPVVFHVLYNEPKEDISPEKLMGVLETLQKDFLAINTDISTVPDEFKAKIGFPNIKFVLADIPGDSRVKNGIIRQFTKEGKFNKERHKMFEESKIIEPSKYLNVYICDVNTGGYYPTESEDKYDGIVVHYENAVKESRTITHETGHWLDLWHIFRHGCKDGDEVCDTPAQKKTEHYCPTYPHIDCGEKSVMFMNFMDYSSCRTFFTVEQVKVMRQHLFKKKTGLKLEKL